MYRLKGNTTETLATVTQNPTASLQKKICRDTKEVPSCAVWPLNLLVQLEGWLKKCFSALQDETLQSKKCLLESGPALAGAGPNATHRRGAPLDQ